MLTSKPKEILHSKRANLQYLEHCRVLVKGGRVQFLKAGIGTDENEYWNIPIANTYAVLLGTGTSITQRAVRLLCDAGVMVGFCGGDGTPLLAGLEIEWMGAQSEYRPTQYVQAWMSFWFKENLRLQVAKHFVMRRLEFLNHVWAKDDMILGYGMSVEEYELSTEINKHSKAVEAAANVNDLLTAEGRLTKALYKHAAKAAGLSGFVRDPNKTDEANRFLSHGNYLAYGGAACCLWCLGIPHAFAVMHGKTRRGALVFDVADLIKDAIVLPNAFMGASEGLFEQEFRERCSEAFVRYDALGRMFNVVKEAADLGAALSGVVIEAEMHE